MHPGRSVHVKRPRRSVDTGCRSTGDGRTARRSACSIRTCCSSWPTRASSKTNGRRSAHCVRRREEAGLGGHRRGGHRRPRPRVRPACLARSFSALLYPTASRQRHPAEQRLQDQHESDCRFHVLVLPRSSRQSKSRSPSAAGFLRASAGSPGEAPSKGARPVRARGSIAPINPELRGPRARRSAANSSIEAPALKTGTAEGGIGCARGDRGHAKA